MVSHEEMMLRAEALQIATGHIVGITENFPPESYESVQHGATPFAAAPRTTTTPLDQTIDAMMELGSWLLGEERP